MSTGTGIEVPEGHPPVTPGGDNCLPDGYPPIDGFEYCNPVEDEEEEESSPPPPDGGVPEPEPQPEDYEPPATKNEIKGTNKDDDLIGTKKSDFINGKNGDDTLTGKNGSDILQGGSGQDVLKGSKGKDYLDGSKGNDTLNGGKGADVFQISKGIDHVEDFSIKQGDRIALDKKGKYTIVDDPDGVLIMASSKKQLFLDGVEYDDVIAAGVDLFVQPAGITPVMADMVFPDMPDLSGITPEMADMVPDLSGITPEMA